MSSRQQGLLLLIVILIYSCSSSRRAQDEGAISSKQKVTTILNLNSVARSFKSIEASASYEIKLCADVPYDEDPSKVFHKHEPGHVFIIMTKKSTDSQQVNLVFGFYPRRPAGVLIFRNVKSQINDNSGRVYDVHIERKLTAVEFQSILDSAIAYSAKKYNLNKYNCYDFALALFNLGNSQPLGRRYIKFPFIAGRGGSPCGIYQDLMKLWQNDPVLKGQIQFGKLKAPDRPTPVLPD